MPSTFGKALALAALGGVLLWGVAASADTGKGKGAGGASTLPGLDGCEVEADLPADLKHTIEQALNAKGFGPQDFQHLADTVEHAGYPKTAACIRLKAKGKANTAAVEVTARGGMPFVIRYGDIPSHIADYYTGQPMRWKELGPLNPQIGTVKTVNGVTNYTKWIPGTEILIPASWNPLDKPLPAPLGGGGGGAAPSPAPTPAAPADQGGSFIDAVEGAASAASAALGNLWGPAQGPDHPEDFPDGKFPPPEGGGVGA